MKDEFGAEPESGPASPASASTEPPSGTPPPAAGDPESPTEDRGGEMTFLDHLEELRRRLMVVMVTMIVGAALGYEVSPWVFFHATDLLPEVEATEGELTAFAELDSGPAGVELEATLRLALAGDTTAIAELPEAIERLVAVESQRAVISAMGEKPVGATELIVTTPAGAVFTKMKIALFVGILLAVPIIIYEAWMFLAPALLRKEKRLVPRIVLPSTVCFGLGVLFSYRILPILTSFFVAVSVELGTEQRWIADDYLGFLLRFLLAGGVLFQLPVVAGALSYLGVMGPDTMRRYRRVAVILILISSAAITPPDPLSMLILGIPMMGLYEVSIGIAAVAAKRGRRLQS